MIQKNQLSYHDNKIDIYSFSFKEDICEGVCIPSDLEELLPQMISSSLKLKRRVLITRNNDIDLSHVAWKKRYTIEDDYIYINCSLKNLIKKMKSGSFDSFESFFHGFKDLKK